MHLLFLPWCRCLIAIALAGTVHAADLLKYEPAQDSRVPPAGWWGETRGQVAIRGDHAKGEDVYLRFDQPDEGGSLHIHRRLTLPDDAEHLAASITVRTAGLSLGGAKPHHGATLMLAFEDTSKKPIQFQTINVKEDVADFTARSKRVAVPDGAATVKLSLGLFNAAGTLDVGGLHVEYETAAARPESFPGFNADGVDHSLNADPTMDEQAMRDLVASVRDKLADDQGVRVVFAPGIYRTPANLWTIERPGSAPLILEAAEPDTVFIRGSQARTPELDASPANWQPVDGHDDLYALDWPYQHELSYGYWAYRYGFPFRREAIRSELLVINGQVMLPRELEAYDFVDPDGPFIDLDKRAGNVPGQHVYQGIVDGGLAVLRPGEFAVTDRPETPEPLRQQLFVRLPTGMTWADVRTVEFSGGLGDVDPLLRIAFRDNVVLRNLTFEHAGGQLLHEAVSLEDVRGVRVIGCDISRNGGRGIYLRRCEDIELTDSRFNDNGQKGVAAGLVDGLLIRDCNMNFNNWRGRYGFVGWDSAAIKVGNSSNVTIVDSNFVGNDTGAIWFDINNTNVLVERVFVYGNFRPGVEFELTPRPGTGYSVLRDSVIGNNFSIGVYVNDSSHNTIDGNVVFDNGSKPFGPGLLSMYPTDQIGYVSNPTRGPRSAEAWGDNIITNNFVYDSGPFTLFGVVHTKTPPAGYQHIYAGLELSHNTFVHATRDNVFQTMDHRYVRLDAWLSEARANRATIDGSNTFRRATMTFGENESNELMRRIEATGVDIPWGLVDEFERRGGLPTEDEYRGIPMDDDEA